MSNENEFKVATLLDVDVRQLINKTKGTNSDD